MACKTSAQSPVIWTNQVLTCWESTLKKIMKMSCLNWLRCVTPLLKNTAAYQTRNWKYCQRWSIITKVTSFFPPFFFLLQFCVNYVASCRWPKVTSKIIGSKSESFSWTKSAWHGTGAGYRVPAREGEISTDSPWREVRLCSWEPKSLSLQGSLLVLQTGHLNMRATSSIITDTCSVSYDLKCTLAGHASN